MHLDFPWHLPQKIDYPPRIAKYPNEICRSSHRLYQAHLLVFFFFFFQVRKITLAVCQHLHSYLSTFSKSLLLFFIRLNFVLLTSHFLLFSSAFWSLTSSFVLFSNLISIILDCVLCKISFKLLICCNPITVVHSSLTFFSENIGMLFIYWYVYRFY